MLSSLGLWNWWSAANSIRRTAWRQGAPRAPKQYHRDCHVGEIEEYRVEERRGVGASEIKQYARHPTAERHADGRREQRRADPPSGLIGRKEPPDDDCVRRYDTALGEPEDDRQDV